MSRLFFMTVLFTLATFVPAFAAEEAQRWAQVKQESSMRYAGGAPAIEVSNFVSDIYFDPTALGASKISLAAVFTPGGASPFHWSFASSSIRKVSEGMYEARGELMSDRGKRPISIPFRVSLTQERKLVLQGSLTIKQGEFNFGADSARFPAEMPANFFILATPLFSGPGVFYLE